MTADEWDLTRAPDCYRHHLLQAKRLERRARTETDPAEAADLLRAAHNNRLFALWWVERAASLGLAIGSAQSELFA